MYLFLNRHVLFSSFPSLVNIRKMWKHICRIISVWFRENTLKYTFFSLSTPNVIKFTRNGFLSCFFIFSKFRSTHVLVIHLRKRWFYLYYNQIINIFLFQSDSQLPTKLFSASRELGATSGWRHGASNFNRASWWSCVTGNAQFWHAGHSTGD